jgi:hypothetical protein
MKKMLAISLACVSLSACANGIPTCNNSDLDGCGRNTAYTEERTFIGGPKPAPAPAPVPVAAPAPAPAPVPAPAPAPAPAPVPDDAPIMKKADEPKMTK